MSQNKNRTKIVLLMTALGTLAVSAAWAVDLAKVNSASITDKDLNAALGSFSDAQRVGILKDSSSRRQILLSLVDQELLLQQGEKEKVDQDAEYKEAFAAFRKQFIASRLLQKNLAGKMTDKAAKQYYSLHKDRFSTDQVHAQHILLATESQANEVLKKAKAKDADFQKLAEELSRDPSAKNNRGDLGTFTREAMVQEFSDAAFSTAPGQIVGPIKTAYGYHIIKVVEKKVGKALGYDEVELKVKGFLRQQLIEEYVGKLKKQAKITIDDKALEQM